MKFCPYCGTSLVESYEGGRMRPMCPSEDCGFKHYGDHSIGTGAVVLRGDEILLVERRTNARSWWQIPGGYVEIDEEMQPAIEREVMEEAGIEARVQEVVGFRHAAGLQPARPVSNIYVIFRLESVSGDPRPDNDETFDAGFFTLAQIAEMPTVSSMSRWGIELALAEPHPGFQLEPFREGLHRPGNTLYGRVR